MVDKQTLSPLEGANIAVVDTDPQLGTISDGDGEFVLKDVPVGRKTIRISFIGYYPVEIKNLIVNSSRQVVLNIEMEQKVESTREITVVGNDSKGRSLNSMATVSARIFSVEETGRYAGSHDDIARMAMNFAGVSGANDQRNDIIIRGNTPNGILWRLDDVDIPNPNHFAATGTTGGPVSILNNNTLRNSDFYTGAFPAEYANVYSGVFDLKMREGNNQKHETIGQIGFNGVELGLEGPVNKKTKSSYFVNYRYSFLDLFEKIGFDFGTSGVPKYQDITYKLVFPVKNGKITFFGLGGKSQIGLLDSKIDKPDLYTLDGMDVYNGSDLWVSALSYTNFRDETTYTKTLLSYVYQKPFTFYNSVAEDNLVYPRFREENKQMKLTFKFLLNKRYNSHLTGRYGITVDLLGYIFDTREYNRSNETWNYLLDQEKSVFNGTYLTRTFGQFSYKFNDELELKPGLSLIYFGLNGTYNVEPRIGFTWKLTPASNINIGVGHHSKILSYATYFYATIDKSGMPVLTNFDLDLIKAWHYVVGYDRMIGENLRFKTEVYYQQIYNAPVGIDSSTYSYLNEGAQWGLNTRALLESTGKGRNYGIEFTLEKFFNKDYYFLITASLFEAKYQGSDGIYRSSAFNGNFVYNALGGKEFKLSDNTVMYFDVKSTLAGGRRYTPIDVEASKKKGGALETVYFEERAFEKQFSNYFKTDVKLGFRFNRRKFSQIVEFAAENVTNHTNPYFVSYSKTQDKVVYTPQMGFLPLMKYRIYF